MIYFLHSLTEYLDYSHTAIVWDNLAAHKSKKLKEYIKYHPHITSYHTPPYNPKLNPQEGVWANLKRNELTNLTCKDLTELKEIIYKSIDRFKSELFRLGNGLLKHSGLSMTY